MVSSLITFYVFPINPNQVLCVDLKKKSLQLEATMELLSSQMEGKQCILSDIISTITWSCTLILNSKTAINMDTYNPSIVVQTERLLGLLPACPAPISDSKKSCHKGIRQNLIWSTKSGNPNHLPLTSTCRYTGSWTSRHMCTLVRETYNIQMEKGT